MQVMRVQSLGQEDPLEKEMATHSSILTWEIPWTEEPGRLQCTGSLKSRTCLSNQIATTTRARLRVKDLISFTWITLLVPWTVCQVGTVIVPALWVRHLRVSGKLNNLPKVTDRGWSRGGSVVLSWAREPHNSTYITLHTPQREIQCKPNGHPRNWHMGNVTFPPKQFPLTLLSETLTGYTKDLLLSSPPSASPVPPPLLQRH